MHRARPARSTERRLAEPSVRALLTMPAASSSSLSARRLQLRIAPEDVPDRLGLGLVDDELAVRDVVAERRVPPIHMPFCLEAAILSRMRSPVTSRSNWAKESSMLSVSRPMEVVVLNCWVTDTKDEALARLWI